VKRRSPWRRFGCLSLVLSIWLIAIGAPPAQAHSGQFTNLPFPVVFNTNGNLVFMSQTKVQSCNVADCRVPVIGVEVKAQEDIIGPPDNFQTVGTNSVENTNALQVTRHVTVICAPGGGATYWRTYSRGYVIDHGVATYTVWSWSAAYHADC